MEHPERRPEPAEAKLRSYRRVHARKKRRPASDEALPNFVSNRSVCNPAGG